MYYTHQSGLKMYYEVHGTGRPLVLLHGGGSTIRSTYGHILPALAKAHRNRRYLFCLWKYPLSAWPS